MKTSENRLYKNCESFIARLHRGHYTKYSSIQQLILTYSKNPQQTSNLDILQKLVQVIGDSPGIITEFNKLIHADLQIPQKADPKMLQ